jgi:hypothetical protein
LVQDFTGQKVRDFWCRPNPFGSKPTFGAKPESC